MAKYTMLVHSKAKPGRDVEYNEWYDRQHFADMCAIPGVKSGCRYDALPGGIGTSMPYLAIFEIDVDNPMSVLQEMGRRQANGIIKVSDAVDAGSIILGFYKVHEARS